MNILAKVDGVTKGPERQSGLVGSTLYQDSWRDPFLERFHCFLIKERGQNGKRQRTIVGPFNEFSLIIIFQPGV